MTNVAIRAGLRGAGPRRRCAHDVPPPLRAEIDPTTIGIERDRDHRRPARFGPDTWRPLRLRSYAAQIAATRQRPESEQRKGPARRNLLQEPSAGLEPATPSLPWKCST